MFWHLLLRKLFNTKIFALKTFSKDPDSVACATIWKTSLRIGGRDAVKWLQNKSGKDFCPLAQSIISAWKTYGKGSYIFFLLLRPVKKLVMLSSATIKFLKFCWWYLRSLPDIWTEVLLLLLNWQCPRISPPEFRLNQKKNLI